MDFGSGLNSSKRLQLYLQNCLLDTRISYCWVFTSLLCKKKAPKIERKNRLKLKNLKFLSICNTLVTLRKLSSIKTAHSKPFCFEKRARDLVSSSGAFWSFYFFKIFWSQINFFKMSEISKNFDIFEFLLSFPNWNPQTFLLKRSGLRVQSLLNDCQHCDSISI